MAIGEQVGGLHRHVVPGADFDVAGAGNGFGHAFRQRRRAHAIEAAADHEDRTASLASSSCISAAASIRQIVA